MVTQDYVDFMTEQFTLCELMQHHTELLKIEPRYRTPQCLIDIDLYEKAVRAKLNLMLPKE